MAKVLVLGGTNFVGRAIVEDAIGKNWDVTIVHRGKTGRPSDWKVKEILLDRTTDIKSVQGEWDAVIDVSGYLPSVVKAAADHFARRAKKYLFISTVAVYHPEADGWLGAKNFVAGETEEINFGTYGPMKLLSERYVEEAFGPNCIQIRPGYVVGPNDVTLRMPYWVDRLDRFDQVLVPEELGGHIQQIDARDLASFVTRVLENNYCGQYTVVGESYTFEYVLSLCPGYSPAKLVRVPAAKLEESGVSVGIDLPLIQTEPREALRRLEPSAALALGLQRRPLEDSLRDTLAWIKTLPDRESTFNGKGPRPMFSREKEEAAIQALSIQPR